MDGNVVRMPRTDEDRLRGAPLRLRFGGEQRDVKPLVLRRSREWKRQVSEAVASLAGLDIASIVPGDGRPLPTAEAVGAAVRGLALTVPETLEDLVFAYMRLSDPHVDVDSLADVATDEEISEALWAMLQATYPFFLRVGEMARLVGSAIS